MNTAAAMHGIRWNLVTTVLRRFFSLALLYYLGSWLSQQDFGVFRTYSLILTIASVFAINGLDSNFITSKKHSGLDLFSFAQIGIGLSVVISILLAFGSGLLGSLYHSRELGNILRWTSLFVVVEVLRKLLRVQAQTQFRFKDLALAETLNVVFYSLASIALLYFYRKVGLYIVLFFLGNALETIYLYIKLPRRFSLSFPRLTSPKWLKISLANLKRKQGFLFSVSLIRLINTYSGNAPILFLGMMVSPALMGVYFFATQLIGVPVTMFTVSLEQVLYPVFAKSGERDTINSINSFARLTLGLGIPLLVFYSFAVSALIPLLFGDKWDAVLPLLYYLIAFFGTSLLNDPISGVPFICRKPQWELYWNIITLVLRLAALALGIQHGFYPAILAFCVVSGVMNLSFYFLSLVLLKAPIVKPLIRVLISVVICLGLVLILSSIVSLSCKLTLGPLIMLAYLSILAAVNPQIYKDLYKVIKL